MSTLSTPFSRRTRLLLTVTLVGVLITVPSAISRPFDSIHI